MSNRNLSFLLALLACTEVLAADGACAFISPLAETRERLRAVELASEWELPAEAAPILSELRGRVRRFLEAELAGSAEGADAAQQQITDALARCGAAPAQFDDSGRNGTREGLDLHSIAAAPVSGAPELLSVQVSYTLPCDADEALYLFARAANGWRLVLALESAGLTQITDGRLLFPIAVAPPDAAGDRYFVVADHPAQCASNWSLVNYRALRLGPTPDQPRVLLSESHGAFMIYDDFNLSVEPDRFTVRFRSSQSLDPGVHNRANIRSFRVAGDAVTRTDPVAEEARGFIDEWLSSPWQEAQGWVAPDADPGLRDWHQRLHAMRDSLYTEFGLEQSCATQECRRVALHCEPREESAGAEPFALFFTVSATDDRYRMVRIERQEDFEEDATPAP